MIKAWGEARTKSRLEGAAQRGGQVSAEKRKAASKAGIDRIKARWPLPSKEWPTADLLEEAGLSLNTVKAVLGSRIIAQHNYQAAEKRKILRAAKRQKEGANA